MTVDDVWASYGAGGLVSDIANVEVELGGHPVEQADIDELLDAGRNGDRPQRPGRPPRPSGALHHRPRAGRAAADRPARQPAGRRHPRHRRRPGAAAQHRHRHPFGAPWRQSDRRLADRRRASPASARRSASSASRWSSSAPKSPTSRCSSAGCSSGCARSRLGARDITNDIACAFAVQRRDAERLKCFYGSAMTSPRDNHEMIEAPQIGAEPGRSRCTDHPRAADDGHPPAHRGTDRRDRRRRSRTWASPARSGARWC